MSSNNENGNSNKRRKIPSSNDTVGNITELGDGLAAIAEFLPKTSRALFAVAMTEGGRGVPNTTSKAILSAVPTTNVTCSGILESINRMVDDNFEERYGGAKVFEKEYYQTRVEQYYESGGWDILDFIDLETDLAMKLTDEDLAAVLLCIDAKACLKTLRLTNCLKIVGSGLNSLRGTLVLEEIDFNIVRLFPEQVQLNGNEECISIELSLALVEKLSSRTETAFKRMQYPCKWWEERGNQLSDYIAGHQNAAVNEDAMTCYFGFDETKEQFVINYLNEPTDDCRSCGSHGNYTSCVDCHAIVCNCAEDGTFSYECFRCPRGSCGHCVRRGTRSTRYCSLGNWGSILNHGDLDCSPYCSRQCRLASCQDGENSCTFCRAEAFDTQNGL